MENSNAEVTAKNNHVSSWEFRNTSDREPNNSINEMQLQLHMVNLKLKFTEQRLAEKDRQIEELQRLASTDPMTGLMNRRGFETFFLQELGRTRRHCTPGSVLILLDVDGLKKINDTHGHQAGDACLKSIAEYLLKKIRNVDAAARIGGDEFAVLLSHTDPEKSAKCLSEIRYALKNMSTVWQAKELHISASVGVSHVSAMSTFEAEYHDADEDLYKNKHENLNLNR